MRRNQYQILHDMLDLLPANGMWTRAERDRWLEVFTHLLDFLIEVQEPPTIAALDAVAPEPEGMTPDAPEE